MLKLIYRRRREKAGLRRVEDHGKHESPVLRALRASFQTPAQLQLVMIFTYEGDLEFHLSQFGAFSVDHTRFFVAEMVPGIAYIHDRGIILRNIKLKNILLVRELEIPKGTSFSRGYRVGRSWEKEIRAAVRARACDGTSYFYPFFTGKDLELVKKLDLKFLRNFY